MEPIRVDVEWMSSDLKPQTPRSGSDGLAAAEDYYLLDQTLSEQERAIRDRVRAFGDREVLPIINDYWERADFPL
jgi:glutaryl-CoA dehydrogenase